MAQQLHTWGFTQESGNIRLDEYLCRNVHGSINHNSEKVETSPSPPTGERIKHVVYAHNGRVFGHQEE